MKTIKCNFCDSRFQDSNQMIEHLEQIPGFRLVQSNTDGLIVWLPNTDEAFNMLDDICYEWETRCSTDLCSIKLGLDVVKEIYQKDVNNYLWVDIDGGIHVSSLIHIP